MTHHLYCGTTYIGRVDDVVEHQGTFVGQFQFETNRETDAQIDRLLAFIDFCSEWFAAQQDSSPPDASAFDQFVDLIGDGIWTIIDESKNQQVIADSPMFNEGRYGELSWVIALR